MIMERERESEMEKKSQADDENRKSVCRRCKVRFDPKSNTESSCRFHPAMFVCRRHDDQKRYYELKEEDPPYAAKFYDCCGAEQVEAPGCSTAAHVSYDHN